MMFDLGMDNNTINMTNCPGSKLGDLIVNMTASNSQSFTQEELVNQLNSIMTEVIGCREINDSNVRMKVGLLVDEAMNNLGETPTKEGFLGPIKNATELLAGVVAGGQFIDKLDQASNYFCKLFNFLR